MEVMYKMCRSREGAWIEIPYPLELLLSCSCRSREGAWIEIECRHIFNVHFSVAPARERGLKSENVVTASQEENVAPARERGLKCLCCQKVFLAVCMSLPRGSVD